MSDVERGTGHPLPASGEARHDEIPESIEREKGRGDDAAEAAAPGQPAVNPDGEAYGEDGTEPAAAGPDR